MRSSQALAEIYPGVDFITLHDGLQTGPSVPAGVRSPAVIDWDVPPGIIVFATATTWLRHLRQGAAAGTWMRKGELALYMGPVHTMTVTSCALILLRGELYNGSCEHFVLDKRFMPEK